MISKTRKICTKCTKLLPIDNFGVHHREKDGLQHACKLCEAMYRKEQYSLKKDEILKRNKQLLKKNPWRATLYHIKERCNCKTNSKYYRYGGRGIKCLITEEELKELWFRDKAYLMDRPSIDRKYHNGNYEYDNCEYMELGKNSLKMNLRLNAKRVYQINLNGDIINEFISIAEASRQTGVSNISKVLHNRCKTAGGFKWEL